MDSQAQNQQEKAESLLATDEPVDEGEQAQACRAVYQRTQPEITRPLRLLRDDVQLSESLPVLLQGKKVSSQMVKQAWRQTEMVLGNL